MLESQDLESSLLQDVLAFIDAFEQDDPNANPPPVLSATAANPPRRRSKLCTREQARSRGDYKAELEWLRHDVAQLEAQLTQLKERTDARTFGPLQSSGIGNQRGRDCANTQALAWKRVAERQLQRRNQAQLTNRNLKKVLAKQLRVAKALRSLFLKHSIEKESELVVNSRASVYSYASALAKDDEQVHALLMDRLQQHYIEIDTCLQVTKLTTSEASAMHTQRKLDPVKGAVLETTSSAPLPLTLAETDERVWFCGIRSEAADADCPAKMVSLYTSDSVAKKYRSTVASFEYGCDVHTQSIMQRFVERDRVVLAWSSIVTTQTHSQRIIIDGMTILERTATPMQTTMFKFWFHAFVDQLGSSSACKEIDMLQEPAQRAVCEDLASKFQALENVLLDYAVEKNRPSAVRCCEL